MTRWLRIQQHGREQDPDRFDPIVEGARLRLSPSLALALWERVRRDATDGSGRCDVDAARRRFGELAGQLAARRSPLVPDIGRLTRVGQELDDADRVAADPYLDQLVCRVPGRDTLVAAEARAAPRGHGAPDPADAVGALLHSAATGRSAHSLLPAPRRAGPAGDPADAARWAQLWAPPASNRGRFVLPVDSPAGARRADATRELAQSLGERLGVPLAEVSVRADEHAGRIAAAHGSIAVVAYGAIHLDPGVYDPETALGRSILAHELAHVAQQRLAGTGVQRTTGVPRGAAARHDRAPWAEIRANLQASAATEPHAEAEAEADQVALAVAAGHAPRRVRVGLAADARPTWRPPGYRGIPPQTQISDDGFRVLPGPVVRVEKLWYEQFFAETHTNAEQMDILLSRLTAEMPWIAQITPAQRQAAAANISLQATFDPGQDTAIVPVSESVQRWVGMPPGTDVDWVFPEIRDAAAPPGSPPRRTAQVYLRATRLESTAATQGGRQLSPALANQMIDRLEAETGLVFNADHRAAIVARGAVSATPITGTALAYDFTATRAWCVASFGEAAWAGFEQRLAAQGPSAGGARSGSTGMTIDDSLDPPTQQFALEWLRRVFGEAQTGAGGTPMHITASVVEAMRAIDALPDDERARVLERLHQPGHGAPTTATLAEQLRGVVQAIRMEDEYARLGIQAGDTPADPIFNRAVEGQIVNHSDLLFTGKRAEFSFQTTSHDDALAVPWVDVTWVVRETASHDSSAPTLDRGHTSHRDLPGEQPERYGLEFDHVGTFEVNAVVNHRFYQPASFTIYVEVKTEQQRLDELEGQTFGRPGGMFGNVIQGEDHTFGDTSTTDSHDRGRILFGQMDTVCRPGDPPLPSPTAPIDDQIDQIRRYIDSGTADATQLSAAQSYLHELEDTQQRLRDEQAAGAHVVYVQGAYLSRTARARSQELKLVADARRVNGNAWQLTIHDVTQAFDNRNSSFHAERATYAAAAEACFVDLCKAYPTGRMSVRIETLDDAGASTGNFLGWELDCTSTWEEIHSVVWNPTVQLVVNIAGTVTMIFLPVTVPFLMPALIAYNGVETVGNLVQYYERDAVHAMDVAMTVGQLAMDLIPYIGRVGRLVQVGSRTYHIMEGLLMAGDAVMVAGQALDQVQELRFGIVRQAAELSAQIEDRQRNNPSDPELPRMRQQFAQLQEQSRDAWARVAADLALQQAIMRLPSHAATHLASIHEGRIQASRSEINDAVGSRGSQRVQASDQPHLERVLGVPIDPIPGSGDVRIVYEANPITGGITGVRLQVGERATLSSVMHHEQTLRAMQRYEGVTGSLRSLLERVQAWRSGGGRIPEGSRAWEAHLELQKLPPMVQALHAELTGRPLDDAARGQIETQIASLEAQIEHYRGALDDLAPGMGYVASLEHAPTGEPHASAEPTLGQAPGHSTTTSADVHVDMPQVPIPPERAATPRQQELLRLRGSGDAVLPNRAPGWTGRLEAEFRWGRGAVDGLPEGYHWTINEAGIPSLVRERLVDEHGNLVPPRRFDDTVPSTAPPEQRFPVRLEDVQRARSTEVEGSYAPTAQTRADQQAAMVRRDAERTRRDTAEAEVDRLRQQLQVSEDQLGSSQFDQTIERLRREHAGEPEVLRQIDDLVRERTTLADARNQVNQESMRIGQLMARDWVAARYPEAGNPVHGGLGAPSRSGDFDAVYVVPRGEGQRPLILIVEAKGGSSTLGTRQVGGQTVQQGTGAYMREIARLMSADPSLPAATRTAMRDVSLGNADVRYVLIEAPIGTSEGRPVLRPGRVSEFNVSLTP